MSGDSNISDFGEKTALTLIEKESLYDIIAAVIGHDESIRKRKASFNLETVRIVEDMIKANKGCNSLMQELVADLLGGAGGLAKGWLRKLICRTRKGLSKTTFKTLECRVATKQSWKTAILITTY